MKEKLAEGIAEGIKIAAIQIGRNIIVGAAASSYYIGIGVSLVALLFYLCGFKKAGKWIGISVAGYFIIQAIKAAVI